MNDNEPVSMVAADVLAIRTSLGLTQLEMSEKIGVSERTFCRWERAEQPVPEIAARLLARIAEDV